MLAAIPLLVAVTASESSDLCAQPAGNCWHTLCCSQPSYAPVYGCFKRRERDFAQCRPIYGWNSTGDHMENIPSRGGPQSCVDDAYFQCPDTWLKKRTDDQAVPEERAHLPSADTVVQNHLWDYSCSANFEGCFDSKCCANPRFDCYKRAGHSYAQCRPKVDRCVDYEWLCPGWEKCGAKHESCLASHCCVDDSYQCHRKATSYYAQCRKNDQPCTPWQHKKSIPRGQEGDAWFCPGWEECSSANQECTLSRCCKDEGHSCFLNKTANDAKGAYYASCRPNPKLIQRLASAGKGGGSGAAGGSAAGGGGGAAGTGGGTSGVGLGGDGASNPGFVSVGTGGINGGAGAGMTISGAYVDAPCEDTSEWLCPESWMNWRDALFESAGEQITSHPLGAGIFTLIVLLILVCVCCAITSWLQRRRAARVAGKIKAKIESQVNATRLQMEIKSTKGKGKGEGAGLVELEATSSSTPA